MYVCIGCHLRMTEIDSSSAAVGARPHCHASYGHDTVNLPTHGSSPPLVSSVCMCVSPPTHPHPLPSASTLARNEKTCAETIRGSKGKVGSDGHVKERVSRYVQYVPYCPSRCPYIPAAGSGARSRSRAEDGQPYVTPMFSIQAMNYN